MGLWKVIFIIDGGAQQVTNHRFVSHFVKIIASIVTRYLKFGMVCLQRMYALPISSVMCVLQYNYIFVVWTGFLWFKVRSTGGVL
jgi:hypothetical protein